MKISDKTVQSYIRLAQKNTTSKYVYYAIGENLWFRVHTKTGNAAWLYRIAMPDDTVKSGYKFSNKTIGQYPIITLHQARLQAAEMSLQVKSGTNPAAAEQVEAKKQVTLQQIWDKWYSVADIKKNTIANVVGLYNNYLLKLADRPLEQVTDKIAWEAAILPLLDAGKVAQASKVLGKLKQLTRFGYESHMIDINPFDRLTIPNEYKTKKSRERTLSIDELKLFLSTLDEAYSQCIIDIRYHHLYKLYLLLGTRKEELAVLKWENYSQVNKTILLTNTKSGDDLLIKLPDQALSLFEELKQLRINDYVFYGTKDNKPLHIGTIRDYLTIITKIAKIENLTTHDLRRTFSSRLSGLKFRLELIEKATNHRVQGTAKHYQHDDMLEERHDMLQAWADYLDGLRG